MTKVEPGAVFHRLTVLRVIPAGNNPKAECRCECGAIVTPQCGALRNGRAKSCGCLRREILATAGVKHGLSRTPESRVYQSMKSRCNDPKDRHFRNYGGRGIRVLYPDVVAFIADVGRRPDGAWIDRIDNDRHYEPGNCRWATPTENHKNKRVSRFWTVDGVGYESSVEAARALNVTPSVVVRGCNGCTRGGRYYPPKPGWSSRLKYEPKEQPCS